MLNYAEKGTLQVWLRLWTLIIWLGQIHLHEPLKVENFLQVKTEETSKRANQRDSKCDKYLQLSRALGWRESCNGISQLPRLERASERKQWSLANSQEENRIQSYNHKEFDSTTDHNVFESRKEFSPALPTSWFWPCDTRKGMLCRTSDIQNCEMINGSFKLLILWQQQ